MEPKEELIAKQAGRPPLDGQRPEYFLSRTTGGLKLRHVDVLGPPSSQGRAMSVYFRIRRQQPEELLQVWVFGCS